MESDSKSQPTRQLSGIKTLPTSDDDESFVFDANPDSKIDNSVVKVSKVDENDKNLKYDSQINGSSGINGGLVKGEEFDVSVIDPDEETLEKKVGTAQNDIFGSGSVTGSSQKAGLPLVEVSGVVDNDENVVGRGDAEKVERVDGVEKDVTRVRVLEEEDEEEEEWGEALEEPELETNGDVGEEWGDGDAVVEDIKVDVVEAVRSGVAVVGVEDKTESEAEPAGEGSVEVDSSGVEDTGVTLKNEEDSVVDNINVDFVEAVRSGVAVVGVEDTSGSEVEPVGEASVENTGVKSTDEGDSGNSYVVESGSVVEDKEERKDSEVEVGATSVKGDSATYADIVESGNVVEANKERKDSEVEVGTASVKGDSPTYADIVESGSAIEDKEEKKDLEVKVEAMSVEGDSVKDSTNDDIVESEITVAEDKEEKDSEAEVGVKTAVQESDSVKSGVTEAAGVKYTDEGDAVVDAIRVDAAEAVRSRTAIVGEAGEVKGSGAVVENSVVEDVTPVLEESVAEKLGQEEPKAITSDETKALGEGDSVVDAIEVNVVEAIRSGVAVVGESEPEGTKLETREVEAPVVENVTLANKFAPLPDSNPVEGVEVEKAQTNDTEVPPTVESSKPTDTEKIKPETDIVSKESSAGENDKVQPNHVADEPDASSDSVEEEKVSSRSYANALVNGPDVSSTEKTQSNYVDDEPDASSASVEGEKVTNRSYASVLVDGPGVSASDNNQVKQTEISNPETEVEVKEEINAAFEEGEDEGSDSDGEGDLIYFGNGNTSRKDIEELETNDHSEMIDGQVVTDSDEEGDSDEDGEGNQPFDSAALAALLRAATNAGTDPSTITVRSQDGSRLFSMERPVGLEPSLRAARAATGANNSSFFSPTNLVPPSEENLSEEDKKKLQFLQQLKVQFLRLVQRVGFTAEHSLAAQVLYKLTVFAGRPVSPAFSLDNAKQTVMQLEAEGKDDLDFSMNILVLGKTGVGKSAIINSIFGEEKVKINAFEPETTTVNMVSGIVDGVKIRFIDAPGLKSSAMEQGFNRKVLASVKKITKKFPPDVMFYVDRLDSQTRDLNDLPLLKTISNSLGTSIWRNAIITLTHASSAPPDGPSGTPLSYEVFVAQRSHIVQQSIGQAVGEMRLMNLNMMNPVSLVENHPACRKNRDGQKILPNGQAWRPQLLLLCYSVKILSEASAAAKTQDAFDARKLFGYRTRSPPLPYLLSSLLQPRTHPKLSADQGGDGVDSDIDLDDLSDSDQEEEEDEYDQLPPFKPLRKAQMAKLSKDQKKAYFEEYDYRVKLLQRKQLREELKRMREAKKNGKNGLDSFGEMPEDYEGENGAPAAVAVPLPDMTLPPSFDSDNPAYRYRFLEPTSQFLARPVLDPHGWDHDCGYEGVNVEHTTGIAQRFPASITVQLNKDKKDFNIHLDSAISGKHGDNGSSLLGFDVQTIGKQYAYIVRGESKFKNLKKNKTAAGITVTFLGENVATGVKVEDQIMLGKRLVLVGSTGTVRSQKDAAYGANMEVRLREADYPVGQEQSSFTLSLMKWRGDLAIGANLQSQVSLGRNSKMAVRAALNNKMSGQITVRTSSSDHMSLALAGLMPIALAIYQKFRPGDVSENYSIY